MNYRLSGYHGRAATGYEPVDPKQFAFIARAGIAAAANPEFKVDTSYPYRFPDRPADHPTNRAAYAMQWEFDQLFVHPRSPVVLATMNRYRALANAVSTPIFGQYEFATEYRCNTQGDLCAASDALVHAAALAETCEQDMLLFNLVSLRRLLDHFRSQGRWPDHLWNILCSPTPTMLILRQGMERALAKSNRAPRSAVIRVPRSAGNPPAEPTPQ